MAVSKRTRFEVLRRDNHTCRYCGGRAPDVVLTVDHVVPTALGGTDGPSNLVAACKDCNAGKASSSPDAETVAQVAEDALRWARAIQRAQELAAADMARAEYFADVFEAQWHLYAPSYRRPWQDVPPDWRHALAELSRRPEVTEQLVADSIATAWSARHVDSRFAYFLGVVNKKVAAIHQAARQLIQDGAV